MFASTVLYTTLFAVVAAPAQAPASDARIANAVVKLIDNVEVPAEEAGRLTAVHVREGARVEEGKTIMAQIEDSQSRAAQRIAEAEYRGAVEKAKNDVNVRYAEAARDVAEADYQSGVLANKKVPGTKPDIEIKKLQLTVKQAAASIEQAQHELIVAGFDAEARKARLDAAETDIRRRQLMAPFNGEVVEIRFRPGEWVQPGDKVLRVVRLDRLRIEGSLNAKDYTPAELSNRPVTVRVKLARGREEIFNGQVVFVNPIVQYGGDFQVLAEVTNRLEGDQWILRPGLAAEMTIALTPTVAKTGK